MGTIKTDERMDIFEILGIGDREDSFTDLLKYIYDNSKDFKASFLKLIFDEDLSEADISFVVRTSYNSGKKKSKKQKDVPDIVLINQNYFAIVEVKVNAEEGDNQTQRYYDHRVEIMKKLEVNPDNVTSEKRKYKFLTLDGKEAKCSHFESITWQQIGECIPEVSSVESDLDLLMHSLKERCESIDVPYNEDDKWYDVVKLDKWKTSSGMYNVLAELEPFKDNTCIKEHWAKYSPADAKFELNAKFGKEAWKSKNSLDKLDKIDYNEPCYNIHFEFCWDNTKKELSSRIDYEFNPYCSEKDLKKKKTSCTKKQTDYIDKNVKLKKDVAKKGKEWWVKNVVNNKEVHNETWWKEVHESVENCKILRKAPGYNGSIKDSLFYLVSYRIAVEENDTVRDISAKIKPFIEIGEKLIDEFLVGKIQEVWSDINK